jgi:hypothetical protein
MMALTPRLREQMQELADNLHINIVVLPDGAQRNLKAGEVVPKGAEVFRGVEWREAPHGKPPLPEGEAPACSS